jgi:hypothetical protein
MSVTPAVPYMRTGLAGCSVDPGISHDARKLTRTPQVIKKKKRKCCLSTTNIFFLLYLGIEGNFFN